MFGSFVAPHSSEGREPGGHWASAGLLQRSMSSGRAGHLLSCVSVGVGDEYYMNGILPLRKVPQSPGASAFRFCLGCKLHKSSMTERAVQGCYFHAPSFPRPVSTPSLRTRSYSGSPVASESPALPRAGRRAPQTTPDAHSEEEPLGRVP